MGTGNNETPKFTQTTTGRMAICGIVLKKAATIQTVANDFNFDDSYTNIDKRTSEEVIIYPNPTSSSIIIQSHELSHESSYKKILIVNELGHVIYSADFNNSSTNIDLGALNVKKGIYLIHIISQKNKVTRKVLFE
jgi:hypothetical protein